MIYSSNFIALLDACVLYPAPVRDFLLSFANAGLFKPKWTAEIQDEWSRNLLSNRLDLTKDQLLVTIQAMNTAFPDSNVPNYRSLIKGLELPDPNDRHVLAAAIRTKADVIVTYNLKDFPGFALDEFDIEVQHPDIFLSNVFDLNPDNAMDSFKKLVRRLKNPPKSTEDVLESLKKANLKKIIERLTDVR